MSNDTLYANAIGARYQWLDCNQSYQRLEGDTLRSFYPDVNSAYAVEVNIDGCIDTSECIVTSVGIQEKIIQEAFEIYPNPTNNRLYLKMQNPTQSRIQIFNIQGRLILELDEIPSSIDVSSFPNGPYFLRIINKYGVISKRFIKVN